jgi:predicted nucleic acid-binding protein
VLIAGTASTTGASHILLRLSELTVIDRLTSQYAIAEAERNLLAKLPAAAPAFRLILEAAIEVIPTPPQSLVQDITDQAHPKDAPILAAAIVGKTDFLATFNVRHFHQRNVPPLIQKPGVILAQIRSSLVALLN